MSSLIEHLRGREKKRLARLYLVCYFTTGEGKWCRKRKQNETENKWYAHTYCSIRSAVDGQENYVLSVTAFHFKASVWHSSVLFAAPGFPLFKEKTHTLLLRHYYV